MAQNMMDYDGPLVRFTEKAFNLIFLNLLTILCCLPVVTFGASFAALNTVVLKMSKNEEGYIAKEFFKAFKANIKIGIKASVAIILFVAFAAADVYAISLLDVWFADVAKVLIVLFGVFFTITVTFLFPIMARFEAGFGDTIKNAFKFSVSHILRTVLLFVINSAMWVLVYFLPVLAPLLLMWGFTLPAYIGTAVYKKEFEKMEADYYARQNI